MNTVVKILRSLFYSLWYLFAIVVVLAAVALSVARMFLPAAGQYQDQIEAQVGAALGQPVTIGTLDLQWRGLGPSVILYDVRFLDQERKRTQIHLPQIRLGIDLVRSLAKGQPMVSQLVLSGLDLSVERDQEGRFNVRGFTVSDSADQQNQSGAVIAWLEQQSSIAIEQSRIAWRDTGQKQDMIFEQVNLSLRNKGERHLMDGSFHMPRTMGDEVSFALDVNGDLAALPTWEGRGYFAGGNLKINQWLPELTWRGVTLSGGAINTRLWWAFKQGALLHLEGELGVFDLVANNKGQPRRRPLRYDLATARFRWLRAEQEWSLEVRDFALHGAEAPWNNSRLRLTVSENATDKEQKLFDLRASMIDVDVSKQWLLLSDILEKQQRSYLEKIDPSGSLSQVQVQFTGNATPHLVFARGQFDQVTTNADGRIPGVVGLSGKILVTPESGVAHIRSRNLVLDMPRVFRSSTRLDFVQASLNWFQLDGGWLVSAPEVYAKNPDAELNAYVRLELQPDQAPFLHINGELVRAVVSSASHYLPATIMSPTLVEWLDRSLVGGLARQGKVLWHGRVNRFPFEGSDGRFEVEAVLKDAELNYMQDWPPASDINGRLIFSGDNMYFVASNGRILDNNILLANINIIHMRRKPLSLSIKGTVTGSTQGKLDYLAVSPPLATRFGAATDALSAQGDSLLNLDLAIPLSPDAELKVGGRVKLTNNSLQVQRLGTIADQINGVFDFGSSGASGQDLVAQLYNQPVRVQIASEEGETTITGQGHFDPAYLAQRYWPALADYLQGVTPMSFALNLPAAGGGAARLILQAEMQGFESLLPPPVNHAPDSHGLIYASLPLPLQGEEPLRIQFGGQWALNLNFEPGDQGLEIRRAYLGLDPGLVDSGEGEGVNLEGHLSRLYLGEWRQVLGLSASTDSTQRFGIAWANRLGNFNLAVKDLELFGLHYGDVTVLGKAREDDWHAVVSAQEALGSVALPYDVAESPIALDFERFSFAADGGVETGKTNLGNPAQFPAIQASIRKFQFNGRNLGRLMVVTDKQPDGIAIKRMEVETKSTYIDASGVWIQQDEAHSSDFRIRVVTQDLARTLNELGYIVALDGGDGVINVNASWPGSPTDFNLELLQGKIGFDLEDGRLMDIEPGAGRVFGLFSFQALPRRLLGDFSDVFASGFAFDSIKGDFKIKDGDAQTKNLYLEGPAARILMKGRIGLVQRDYDQEVIVIPHLTDSIPILGWLAFTPQVAAVIAITQRALKNQLDKLGASRYTITGSWDNPVIKSVD